MPEPVRLHNSLTWLITFAGINIEGFGPADFCVITPPKDSFKATEGGRGEVAVSFNPSKLHVVKLSLLRTSSGNVQLSRAYAAQVANANAGLPIGRTFTAYDRTTGETWRGAAAWIVDDAERKVAAEVPIIDWNLNVVMDQTPSTPAPAVTG